MNELNATLVDLALRMIVERETFELATVEPILRQSLIQNKYDTSQKFDVIGRKILVDAISHRGCFAESNKPLGPLNEVLHLL